MEQWKVDIADSMVSWDYIPGSAYGIQITLKNWDADRNKVWAALNRYMGALCTDVKDVRYLGQKIVIYTGSTQAEDQLKGNLNKIYSEVAKYRETVVDEETEDLIPEIQKRNTEAWVIFIALVTAIIWILLVWNPKK